MKRNVLHLARLGSMNALALTLGVSVLVSACGGGGVGGEVDGKASHNELSEAPPPVRITRLCDLSGCYIAWSVVDSDGDGVCDADETMAGTNPYDRLSKPSLLVVAELSGKSQLPSFEAGRGAFAVFPAEMQARLQEYYKGKGAIEMAQAFPLGPTRGDSLSRVGIDADMLKDYSITMGGLTNDPLHDGFSIGLKKNDDSGIPGRRVGGIEMRLISENPTPLSKVPDHGGERNQQGYKDGGVVHTYKDGFTRTNQSDKTVVWRNEEGKVTKVHPGSSFNPDADTGSAEPTPEQKKALERLRGAAVNTVDGWSAPSAEDPQTLDRRTLIMLIDPEYLDNTLMVLDQPRVTDAQPEVHPNLPRPDLPAVPTGGKDTCTVGCAK
ncbi:MAG: thrombospondin type 3 repeat-containing protein [Pseudomonadota bacterium]